jgi:Ca-activated chloride channel homolog
MKHRFPVLLLMAVWLILTAQIWRDTTSRKNAEGNARFRQKEYPEALEKYVDAQNARRPRPEISYNIANSLYEQKKYSEALKEYDKLTTVGAPEFRQMVYFNRGNNLYQMGQYEAAAESFQKALELEPSDLDSKHNLELTLKKIRKNANPSPSDSRQKQDGEGKDSDAEKGKKGKGNEKSDQSPPSPQKNQQTNKGSPERRSDLTGEKPADAAAAKPSLEPREALQLLDAVNDLEKKEQRRQVLKIQKERAIGRDW